MYWMTSASFTNNLARIIQRIECAGSTSSGNFTLLPLRPSLTVPQYIAPKLILSVVVMVNNPAIQNYVSTLLNCEWMLYVLNFETDLKFNPYLEYWVRSHHELKKSIEHSERQVMVPKTPTQIEARNLKDRCSKARLEIVHHILTRFRNPEETRLLQKKSPEVIFQEVGSRSPWLVLSTYKPMLEAMGNYSLDGVAWVAEERILAARSLPVEARMASITDQEGKDEAEYVMVEDDKTRAAVGTIPPINPKTTAAEVEEALQADQQGVIHALTRLPVDLNSLNLLTNLLTSPIFQSMELNGVSITCEYIQHSLRTIERMTAGSSASDVDGYSDASASEQSLDSISPGGREEGIRAVKLLVIFLRSLLRRGTMAYQDLYFDIEEICVRYIWIKEVREFREFLNGLDIPSQAELDGGLGG
jgi:hypothetical protein